MRSLAVRIITIIVLIAVVTGCQSNLQNYIADHSKYSINYGTGEHVITVSVENPIDFNSDIMSELIWVQKRINDSILPDDKDLKRFTIFLPNTVESFDAARKRISGVGDSPSMAFIAPISRIVVFTPKTWRERSLGYIVETYIHELMHYVALQIDGDLDANHSKPDYWAESGLVSIIYHEWLNKNP